MNFKLMRTSGQVTICRIRFFLCIAMFCLLFPHVVFATGKDTQIAFSQLVEVAKGSGVQKETLLLVTQEVLEEKLKTKDAACLLLKLVDAKASGLPITYLEEKMMEGRAKGISGVKICGVIESMVEEMNFSKQLLVQKTGAEPQEATLRRMFEIRSQGITRDQVKVFFSSHTGKNEDAIVEGLRLYSLLKQAGVPSHELDEFVALVMKDDATLMRWKEVPQLYSLVIRRGGASNVFMSKAIEAVKDGILPHQFARELSLQPRSLGVLEQSTQNN